jgi:hypothetical protein
VNGLLVELAHARGRVRIWNVVGKTLHPLHGRRNYSEFLVESREWLSQKLFTHLLGA